MHPLKIMVVDDDPEIHEGIRFFLNGDYSVTSFTSGEDALVAAAQENFPVAILDLRTGGLSGIEVLKELKKIYPHQQAIILTGHSCCKSAMSAVNLGAFRYLTKPLIVDHFRETISAAFERYAFETNAQQNLVASPKDLETFGLSRRESEVAFEILQDQSNPSIAKTLGISQRTVEKHVENVLSFFSISRRNKLAAKIKDLRKQLYSSRSSKGHETLSGTLSAVVLASLLPL